MFYFEANRYNWKWFYNRQTTATLFWIMKYIKCHSYPPTLLCNSNSWFLIQGSQPIMISGETFSQWWNPYKEDCLSILESLLYNYILLCFFLMDPKLTPFVRHCYYHFSYPFSLFLLKNRKKLFKSSIKDGIFGSFDLLQWD